MNTSLLEKYGTTRPGRSDEKPIENDTLDDLGAFGYLRGIGDRAIMLELRYKNGNCEALAYAWLERAVFDPSEGITLQFGTRKVLIAGQNLNAEVRPNVHLFAGIVRHRVPWIVEAGGPVALLAPQGSIIVDRLMVE